MFNSFFFHAHDREIVEENEDEKDRKKLLYQNRCMECGNLLVSCRVCLRLPYLQLVRDSDLRGNSSFHGNELQQAMVAHEIENEVMVKYVF